MIPEMHAVMAPAAPVPIAFCTSVAGGALAIQRDRTFRALIDNALDLVALIADDGTLLYVSPSHETILGYAPSELVGRCAFDFLHPDDRPVVMAQFAAGLSAAGVVAVAEFRFRDAAGDWRVCEARGRDLRADPAIGAILFNTRDITARKQAEADRREDLAVGEALGRIAKELIPTHARPALLERLCRLAVGHLHADGSCVMLLDRRARRYLPVASLGAAPCLADPMHPDVDGLPALADRLEGKSVVAVGGSLAGETSEHHGLCIGLYRGTAAVGMLFAARGESAGPFSSTERRIAKGLSQLASFALENARLMERLERANRIKSDFVATMSHELRTPLHIIIGNLSLLADGDFGPLTDEQRDAVGTVDRSARSLLDLVQDTLDLSRLERGGFPVHCKRVDVGDLLHGIEREMRKAPRAEAVSLSSRVEGDVGDLSTDPGKLKIVLRNLLGNALKFTKEGSVSIVARPCGDGVEFSVDDTGVGIPAASFSKIFEPFSQLGEASTRERGGVGMGLYLSSRLSDLLGGTISVESRLGCGSTFKVWIPAMFSMAKNGQAHAKTAARTTEGRSES